MSTGDVVLLQSEEMVTSFVDPKMGWSNFVKGQILALPDSRLAHGYVPG